MPVNTLLLWLSVGLLALFSLQNRHGVMLRFLLAKRGLPLSYLILIAFFLGMAVAIFLNRQLRSSSSNSSKKKKGME